MGNSVSPFVERVEQLPSLDIPPIERLHLAPDFKTEPCEICADIAGIGVAPVEFTVPYQLAPEQVAQRGGNLLDDVMHALRVQVPAKSLELGGQEHSISMVYLLRCIAAPTASASNGTVHFNDLVKFDTA
jgi:hypothetical protein